MTLIAAVVITAGSALAAPAEPPAALPDPTRPYAYAAPVQFEQPAAGEKLQWRLNGVTIRDGERSAIINGHMVKVGDSLGSASVLEINAADVVLLQDSRRVIVRLLVPGIKKPTGLASLPAQQEQETE